MAVARGVSQGGSGTATAPGAGTSLATIAALGPGSFDVTVTATLGSAAVLADFDNLQLFKAATVVGPCASGPGGSTTTYRGVQLASGDALTVKNTGAGTAAVVYGVVIVATRTG